MQYPKLTPRKGPPSIEEILPEVATRTDAGYAMKVHLHGLRGTWHRLWAMVASAKLLGGDDTAQGVAKLRSEFEQLLGRAMTAEEWDLLEDHAVAHARQLGAS